MGIYDQLSQLDKVQPSPSSQKAATSLNAEPEQTTVSPPADSHSKPADKRKKKSKHARLQESKHARMEESKKASLSDSERDDFLAAIQPYLDLRASHTVSFRYPDTLLAWLDEAVYQLKKARGQKVTKNALLVAALAYVLGDWEQHQEASFLYQQFIQDE